MDINIMMSSKRLSEVMSLRFKNFIFIPLTGSNRAVLALVLWYKGRSHYFVFATLPKPFVQYYERNAVPNCLKELKPMVKEVCGRIMYCLELAYFP
jgi:hypothetical protein